MIRKQAKRNKWTSGLQRIRNARTRQRSSARDRAVSPVIAEIILVGLTLTLGAAFWSTARTTGGAQLTTYVEDAASDINKINENFIISNFAFDYDQSAAPPAATAGMITVWFYNNGKVGTDIAQIQLQRVSTQEVATFELPEFVLGATNCTTESMNASSSTCIVVDVNDPTSGPVITMVTNEIYKVTAITTRGKTGTLQEVAL